MAASKLVVDELHDILSEAKRGICHAAMPRDAASFILIKTKTEKLLRDIESEHLGSPGFEQDLSQMKSMLDI